VALCPALAAAIAAAPARGADAWGDSSPFLGDETRTAPVARRPRAEPPAQPAPVTPPEPLGGDNARTAPVSPRQPSPQQATADHPAKPAVEEWPPPLMRRLSLESEKLSEAVFNLLEDVEVLSIAVGPGRLDAHVGRRVFDNHDVLGSWTVVDHIRLNVDAPFYVTSWPIFGNLTGGFGVTGGVATEFIDIRQVQPRDFAHLPSLEARAAESEQWQPASPPIASAPPRDDQRGEPWSRPFAGLEEARYGKLWNMVSFPVRIPTQAEWISHMSDGEVISFIANGTIETGPSVSWQLDVTRVTDMIRADASVGAYVSGQFRVSILREDARHARLRVTRQAEAGMVAQAGGRTDDVVRGVLIGPWDISHGRSQITPFFFAVRDGKGRGLDLVYRYDLAQTAGRLAFEAALAGRLGMSERYAGGFEWQDQSDDAPVHKLAERSTGYTQKFKGSGARYGLLYRHNHDSTVTDSDITAVFREGTTRVFRSDTENDRSWRFIWGTFERFDYRFRIDVDRDRAEIGAPDAATLVVQAELSDSDTTGADLYAYMNEVESATGRRGFFPRPPRYAPDNDFPRYDPDWRGDRRRPKVEPGREIDYYRSSFYYQLTFSQDQIERFVSLPSERMWPMLEAAFGVPAGSWETGASRASWSATHLTERVLNIPLYALNLHYRGGSILEHARAIRASWMRAGGQTSLEERVKALGEMFSDRRYSAELVRLLRMVLAGERVSYAIQGSSHAFGYLRDAGIGATALDPLPVQKEWLIDFDRQIARPQADPEAAVSELDLEPLGGGRFRLSFAIPEQAKPRALYASLVEVRPWRFPRSVGQAAYIDREGIIAGGKNTLVLSTDSGAFSDLLGKIEPGNAYILKLAYSRDGRTWGPIAETRFVMPEAP
jgi:hypothetical protein